MDAFYPVPAIALVSLALSILVLACLAPRAVRRMRISPSAGRRHNYHDKWLEALERISSRLDSCEVRSVLTEMAASTLRARTVNIWLYDQGTRCYLSTSSRMEARFRKVPASHRLVESMLSSGDPFNFADAGDEGEIADFAFFTGSIVCAPLITSRELVGFMTIGPQTNGVAYSESDVKLLSAFATQAAVQIKNIRLGEDLLDMKESDAFNRACSFIMHDLKNFTHSLSLLSHNARANISSPEFQREAIKAIDLTAARMRSMIEKISGGAGHIKTDMRAGDLMSALENAAKRLPASAARELSIESPEFAYPCLMDSEAVETVFFNILMNAHEATCGRGQIKAGFHAERDSVVVRISDNGSGIPRPLLEKGIFRPFVTTKQNGFGIGLHQCKTVMESHGGMIEVESEEGRGTVFTLRFPANGEASAGSRAV
ncbi:MAG TPA: ATP-binding protein [Thermodesulfobacteriota bacterium]